MSFDPDAYLATLPTPANEAAPSFDPDTYLASVATPETALRDPNATNTTRSAVTGFTAAEAQARGEQGAAGLVQSLGEGAPSPGQFFRAITDPIREASGGDTIVNALPTAARIAGPVAGLALAPLTLGASIPAGLALAVGGAAVAEPIAQGLEKATGQRDALNYNEGVLNVAVGGPAAMIGLPGARGVTSVAQRIARAGANIATGATVNAAQGAVMRGAQGQEQTAAAVGQDLLTGGILGGVVGTGIDELLRAGRLDRAYSAARAAGFQGQTEAELRAWAAAEQFKRTPNVTPAATAPATRPPVLDLEVMPRAGETFGEAYTFPPTAQLSPAPTTRAPLALPPVAVSRDVLRLMPGSEPLALPAPAPEPTAPIVGTMDRPENQVAGRTPSPVAVEPVPAAPVAVGNLPDQPIPAPSATVQSPPPLLEAAAPASPAVGTPRKPKPISAQEAERFSNLEWLQPGRPGLAIEPGANPPAFGRGWVQDPADLERRVVYRDETGAPTAYLMFYLAEPGSKAVSAPEGLRVYVSPELRRKGIARQLYTTAQQAGYDVMSVSGTGAVSEAGRALSTALKTPAPQPPAPLAAATPTALPEPVASNETPSAAVPLPGADQPAPPAPESKPAPRPHAALPTTQLKAKIQSLQAGIAKPGQTATRKAKLNRDLFAYETELATRRAEKAAAGKGKGRGFGIPALPDGTTDLLNDIEAAGGIRTGGGRGGENDDVLAAYGSGITKTLLRKDAQGIDQLISELRDAYGHRGIETPQDLETAVARALANRERAKKVYALDQQTELFRRAALENKGRGGTDPTAKPIAPEKITEGDTFKIKREPVTVAAIDPVEMSITLKDGERFGTQIVPAGVPIYADAKSYKPAPADKAGISVGEVVRQLDARAAAEAEVRAIDWDAVMAANQAEAAAAVDDLPAPAAAAAILPRGKAQTVDMFDSGAADMDFTLAGQTTGDATGNMDRMAQAAADKAAADAAQSRLFDGKLGAASGAAEWAAIRRKIDPQSVLPEDMRNAIRFGTQAITGHLVRARDNQADLLRALKQAEKTTPNVVALTRAYLDGNLPLAALPQPVRYPASAIRHHIDALSERAVREGVVGGQLATTLLDNVGKYLRRSYRIFEDASGWKATREFQIARKNWIAYLTAQTNPATGQLYTRNDAETLTNQLLDREAASSFMIGGKLAGRDVSSLIKRKDLPPELRALYGEITDPIEAYGQTIPRLARLVENHAAQQWMRMVGLRTGIFDTSPTPLNHRPLVSDSNQPHEVFRGLYTQPVIARALEREVSTSPRAFSAFEAFFKVVRTLTGVSKMTKTVLNPDSYAPNFIGGIITTLANGNLNLAHTGRGFMLAAEELGILRAAGILPQNRAQLKDDLAKLAKLGLRSEGLDAADLLKTWERSLLPAFAGKAKRAIETGLSGYGQIDNATKYLSWKNETARLKKWMPANTPLETLERIAAERVRATTQVYGKVPKIITDLSQLGLAPSFVSFTWELFRNTGNTARIAFQDMAEGARTGNKAQQWDGARRLAALLAVVGAGLGITALSRRENGITDEVDDAVRFFGPTYDENASLHYNTPLKDGRVNVSNVSYLLPHILLTEAVMSARRGDTGEEQTKRFLDQVRRQFLAADGGVFVGPALEAFVGYNRDTGLPVYNKESPTPTLDAMGYVADRSLNPLILRKVENYVKAARGEIGPNGKVFSASDENWRLVGARQQTRDLPILAEYKARDLSRRWVNASKLYTDLAGRNIPAEDIEAGYQRATQARQRVAAEIKDYFRLGQAVGITEDQLIKNLRSGQGLSAEELLGVIDGKYVDQPRDRQQSAVQVLDRAKRLPEDKRMAAVAAEIVKDPKLVKGIMREVQNVAKGITQQDRLILALDVADGSRARYLANQITTGKVPAAEIPAYLEAAKRKGILTDAVYQQLKTGSWRDLDQ